MEASRQSTILRVALGVAVVTALGVLCLSSAARAVSFEDPSASLGLGTADLKNTVVNIINWALGLLGLIGVGMMIYGGYTWMTAAGNEDRVRRAKRIIINTSIGLVIILLAWAIVNFVLNFGNTVTGPPPGGQCTAGEVSGCYVCDTNGQWQYDGNLCPLPVDTFEIRDIVTSCGNPPDYRDDVFLCSGVSVIFNKVVDESTVGPRVADDTLTVEQCGAGSDFSNCVSPSQPTPLFNDTSTFTNEIEYSGALPSGDRAEFVANNKSISFVHGHELFAADTFYRLTIPKNLKDLAGNNLSECRNSSGGPIPGCDTTPATSITWIFRVGSKNDVREPSLASTYPVSDTASARYPDRNVNRNAILWARFDEAIAPWTITEANITVAPITGTVNADGTGGSVGAPIDPAFYDVYVNGSGNGFELVFSGGFELDAFAWYEISVGDLTDMCSNNQQPNPALWRFQTNGVGAGIATVYPPDGYQYSCHDTEFFVLFNTSMYDPARSGCRVQPPLGYVTSGTVAPSIPRLFEVEDDYPGYGNPNDFCKKYSWEPTAGRLNYNTTYNADVDTRYQIDADGNTLSTAWSFRTAANAGSCVNAPVLTKISPNVGPVGQCLSAIGSNFDTDGNNTGPADGDSITFGGTPPATVTTWTNNAVVTDAPTVPNMGANGFPDPRPVQVTVNHPVVGPIRSNTLNFWYTNDPAYTGPCLYQLNPSTGVRSQGYQLIGDRFDPTSSTKTIHFGPLAVGGTWTNNTVANSSVPATAPLGQNLVSLENDDDRSNELPFTVAAVPPGTFSVIDVTPTCGDACPNADVRATFGQQPDGATVTGGATAVNGTAELFSCGNDPTCAAAGLTEVAVNLQLVGSDLHLPPSGGMQLTTWYRAIIRGGSAGVKSASGNVLGGLNYDADADGTNDAYSWIFGSSDSTGQCALSFNTCTPAATSVAIGGTRLLAGRAYTDPNTCNAGGEELDPFQFTWTWSSADNTRATVAPTTPNPSTTATGLNATINPIAITDAVTDGTRNASAQCQLSVTTSGCVTDADCTTQPSGVQCPGSQCVSGICTPTITNVAPTVGAVGDWVTLSGCYFDQYVGNRSSVVFLQNPVNAGDDKVALWPNTNVCGPAGTTWSPSQIVVEVPERGNAGNSVTTTGPLRVVRGTDLRTTDSSQSFDPSGNPTPGICSVTPASGQAGVATVRLRGQNFGPNQTPGFDFVTFYSGVQVPDADTTWTDDTDVSAKVPSTAQNNPAGAEIVLTNDGQASNPVNFDIIPPACSVCSLDTDCGNTSTLGCGQFGPFQCCGSRPVATIAPTGSQVCLNAAMSVQFRDSAGAPIDMETSTITPATVTLERNVGGVWTPVVLSQSNFQYPTSSSLLITTGVALASDTDYRITVRGDQDQTDGVPEGVLTTRRIGMAGNAQQGFHTVNSTSLCAINHVQLDPPFLVFTAFGASAPVTARTFEAGGTEIQPIYGTYDWDWAWGTDDAAVATVTNADTAYPSGIIDSVQTVGAVGNGTTLVRATATGRTGWVGTRAGTASVSVNACVQPWPAAPPFSEPNTHFNTWFCRDGGLPDLNAITGSFIPPASTGEDELLMQIFFENPVKNPETNVQDAIGILVYENEEHLSPTAWFEKKFGKAAPGGTFKVDGYEALRDGTTTYIAGTNLGGSTLYTNIYVFGYNESAAGSMGTIFGALLNNLRINTNAGAFAYGGTDSATALTYVRRDTKRFGDLADYRRALQLFGTLSGGVPSLPAGSYITGMSTSRWPSWLETLTPTLREVVGSFTPREDPLNNLEPACTAPYDPPTCWDEAGKKFLCPSNSHIYAYQSNGTTYSLFANFEYGGTGSWQTGSVNPCSSPSSCACFNFQLAGTIVAGASTDDLLDPDVPQGLTVHALSPTEAELTWASVADAGESGVQTYFIYQSTDGTTFQRVAEVAPPSTSVRLQNLTPGATYTLGVLARDSAGNASDLSTGVAVAMPAGPDHLAPGAVREAHIDPSATAVTLRWQFPEEGKADGTLLYRVVGRHNLFSLTEQGVEFVADLGTDRLDFTDEGLEQDATYTYGLFAYDTARNASPGVFLSTTTHAPVVSVAGEETPAQQHPASLPFTANALGFDATGARDHVLLTWVAPANVAYAGVVIRRSTTAFPTGPTEGDAVATLDPTVTSIVDRNVIADQTYFYAAFAHNATPLYASGVFTDATTESRPPAVTDVAVPLAAITADDVEVRWTTDEPASTIVALGTTTAYELGTLLDGALIEQHAWRASDFGRILKPGTTYHIRLTSVDAQGNLSTVSDHVVVTDAADTAGLTWEGYADALPVATWNGSTDPQQCDGTCNQYYTCTSAGAADCDDSRNGSEENPGAGTICGALAVADCLDGSADLPQGPSGTLTTHALAAWNGTRLPTAAEYTASCALGAPATLPLPDGTWTSTLAGSVVIRQGWSSGASSCTLSAQERVSNAAVPYSAVTPTDAP